MNRILLSNFICIAFLFFIEISACYSQAIHSVHDGNWEDSTTWNTGSGLPDTIAIDTIIISNNVNYNGDLLISNCYLRLDSGGSLCGHHKFHVFQCEVRQMGGSIYTDHGYEESSHWLCTGGTYQFLLGDIMWGQTGSWHVDSCHCTEFGGGNFACSVPVLSTHGGDSSVTDTTTNDTIIPPIPHPAPLVIQVYPNPTTNQISISSEIPDSNSKVILTFYDLLGRNIETVFIPNGKSIKTIFTHNWAAGMYLLRFMNGGAEIKTEKIVRVQ